MKIQQWETQVHNAIAEAIRATQRAIGIVDSAADDLISEYNTEVSDLTYDVFTALEDVYTQLNNIQDLKARIATRMQYAAEQ